MKPTMYEFLHSYFHNLYEAMSAKNLKFENIELICEYCPFKEQCREASESGDESRCGNFIRQMLMDGDDYKA